MAEAAADGTLATIIEAAKRIPRFGAKILALQANGPDEVALEVGARLRDITEE